MTLTFKRLNDEPENYYDLDLCENGNCGDYLKYVDNDPKKGYVTGKMIRLRKYWRFDRLSNYVEDVYVTPMFFTSEFYPADRLVEGCKVEQLIKEAQQARIDNMYKDTKELENPLLDTVSKELGKGESSQVSYITNNRV